MTSEHTLGPARGRSFTSTFSVIRQNDAFIVETREGRFAASVIGNTLRWRGQGGGNMVDVELFRNGDSISGTFSGNRISNNEPIAGTYTGRRTGTTD